MISDLLFPLRAILRRGAVERELDDELRLHLEQETEKLAPHPASQAVHQLSLLEKIIG